MGNVISNPFGKVEFGNVEQIKFLRAFQRKCEEEDVAKEDRQKKKFRVRVDWSGSATINVDAVDGEEAREIALEDIDTGDGEIDYVRVTEVKEEGEKINRLLG